MLIYYKLQVGNSTRREARQLVEKKTYFKDRHLDPDITQPLCDLGQVTQPL